MEIDWTEVWEDLVPRLMLLAASRLSRLFWRGCRSGAPSVADAEDFVLEAITKTMEGRRVWNRNACSLFDHLSGVIISDINHAASSADNRTTSGDRNDDLDDPPDDAVDPAVAAERSSDVKHLLAYLHGIDPALGRLGAFILIHDLDGTEELAHQLAIPTTEVRNLRKRMIRAVRKYLLEEGE